MADCNHTALPIDLTLTNLVVFTREAIKVEAALATAAIFGFAPLIGLYADMISNLRAVLKSQLGTLNLALANHATCWNGLGFDDCFLAMTELRNTVSKLQEDPHPELYQFLAEVELLRKRYQESACGRVTVASVTSPDETVSAENVDLELHFHGRFGTALPLQYTIPQLQQAREQKVRHKLQPKPGGGGPTFWIECTVFDIETWRVGAEAEMVGAAVSSEAPFVFEWTFDGAAMTQGVATIRDASSVEFTVPTQPRPRTLSVRATSKSGIVLEHSVVIRTRATREECSPAEVPYLLPAPSLVRSREINETGGAPTARSPRGRPPVAP